MRYISSNMQKCYLKLKKSTWPCVLANHNCQRKNKNWACIHELKCLLVFNKIKEKEDENTLCKELIEDKIFADIGKETQNVSIEKSRESSIKQKIYNIHFLYIDFSGKKINGLGIRKHASETTKEIFKEYNSWSVEKLEQAINKLKDFILKKN